MRGLNPKVVAAIVAGLVLLLLAYVAVGRNGGEDQDKLSDDQVAGTKAGDPEQACGSQATYDLIKRELFRRAGQLRGSDQGSFDRLAAYSVVRMDSPMLKSHDEEVGSIQCSGSLALDLPPGVAVVGGRRTLTADIGYAVQDAADGSGKVLTLSNADAVITPLATLARVGQPTGEPLGQAVPGGTVPGAVPPATIDDPAVTQLPPIAPRPVPPQPPASIEPGPTAPAPVARATPSFNCRNARSRSEIAVCGDTGLASLDRQMASQFNSAMANASPAERALLERTRGRFLSYRNGCRSDDCIADAYRGRMTEISDIMAGRWSSSR
jgi:uncharacterized protein YecT (DUF1311 family)